MNILQKKHISFNQVLSRTTASALVSQGRHDTKSTINFITIIDKVFDCLNVSKINKGRHGKKELEAYKSADDWRFKVSCKLHTSNIDYRTCVSKIIQI